MDASELTTRLMERVERLRLLLPSDRRELEAAAIEARAALMSAAAVGVTVGLALTPGERASATRQRLMDWASRTLDEVRGREDEVDAAPLHEATIEAVPPPSPPPKVHVPSPKEIAA